LPSTTSIRILFASLLGEVLSKDSQVLSLRREEVGLASKGTDDQRAIRTMIFFNLHLTSIFSSEPR
jgi:hypothetical protein